LRGTVRFLLLLRLLSLQLLLLLDLQLAVVLHLALNAPLLSVERLMYTIDQRGILSCSATRCNYNSPVAFR
jgi:hypothetical protein